jgi:hypothetical protein
MNGSMNGSMNGAMGGNPAMATHLAELDARYEAHLAALRDRAEHAREVVRNASAALASSVRKPLDLASVPVDEAYASRSGGARPSYYDNTTIIPNSAILPDSPLGGGSRYGGSPPPSLDGVTLDDDGIPLWQD